MAQQLDHHFDQGPFQHAPKSRPPSPTTQSAATSSRDNLPMEELNACLGNLFVGPSQGIEQAFKLVLGLLHQQEEKVKTLTREHEQVKKQNDLLLENMKDLQDSRFICLEKLKQSEKITILHEGVALEVKQLHDTFKEIKGVQSQTAADVGEMKEEMKVMAFNLQLDHGDEDSDLQAPTVDSGGSFCEQKSLDASSDLTSCSTSQTPKSDATADDNQVKQEEESVGEHNSPKVQIDAPIDDRGDESVGETIDTPMPSQEEDNASSQPKPEIYFQISPLSKTEIRRKSRKLRVDETLASRLARLEKDKIALQEEMAEMKELLANIGTSNDAIHVPSSGDSLAHVNRRVSMVEGFLSGFGAVYNEDSGLKEIVNMKIVTADETPRYVDFDGSDSDVDELIIGNDSKDEIETSLSDHVAHVVSRKHNSALARKQLESVSVSAHASAEKLETDKDDLDIHSFIIDTVDNQDAKTTHASPSDDTSELGLSRNKEDSKSTGEATDLEYQQGFAKQKGLLLHLLDQEARFKENVFDISSRLVELESNYESRVSRKSMVDYLTLNTIREEAVSLENEPKSSFSAGIESPPVPAQELESIRSSVEQMAEELDSKVSMEVLKKEIEIYLFQPAAPANVLSGESERPLTPGIAEESLRQFKTIIQQQFQFINDKKIDRETLSQELTKKSDGLSEKFNNTLSSYESRTIDSLNAINYDVNECKRSIEDLQNQSHYANSRSDDMNMDIDKRIRSATEAVQSNFNDIISSRLEGIKAVEDEMEKVASHLAEKPDQAQINKMLQDLETSVLKHVGVDETVKSALANVKTDLKQKLTKEQVLGLVKQLLRGAKEDITRSNSGSLMVGYKCIGCNEVHEGGVNKSMAVKVNHNALPLGRAVMPPVFPYCRSLSDTKLGNGNKKRNLAPLSRRPSFGTSGYRGSRPRPRTSPNQITHRKTR